MKDPHNRQPAGEKQPSDSIPLQDLLENADVYTLRNFLRNETKRNKQLTIRLKTRLIESAVFPGLTNKYETLIGELVREDSRGIVNLPRREIKLLAETCVSVLKLFDKELASQAYRECYLIVFGVLTNVHRYLNKSGEEVDELDAVLIKASERLKLLMTRDLAPELRDDIRRSARKLISKSYHVLPDIKLNILSAALVDNATSRELLGLVSVAHSHLTPAHSGTPWIAWYAILSDLAQTPLDVEHIKTILEPSDMVLVARTLFESGYESAGYAWVDAVDGNLNIPETHIASWKRWKFDASSRKGGTPSMLDTGVELMLETADMTFYEKMENVVDPGEIETALAEEEAYDVLARVFIHKGDYDRLVNLIEGSRDIGIITNHVVNIVERIENVEHFLRSNVRQFLTHRAGLNCTNELNRLIGALELNGYRSLAGTVRDEVFSTYPGRFTETPEGLDISF